MRQGVSSWAGMPDRQQTTSPVRVAGDLAGHAGIAGFWRRGERGRRRTSSLAGRATTSRLGRGLCGCSGLARVVLLGGFVLLHDRNGIPAREPAVEVDFGA